MVVSGLLLLLTACDTTASERRALSTNPLAESVAQCFGYTARLTLLRADMSVSPATLSVVGDAQWQLEVEGPAGRVIDDELTASLDVFTIRGERANRDDLALARWSGATQVLTTRGRMRFPEIDGAIRDGDQGRILAWIQTPGGSFGIRGFTFHLHPAGFGIAIVNPSPLLQEPCPVP